MITQFEVSSRQNSTPLQPLPLLRADLASVENLQPPGWPDITRHFDFYTSSDFCFPIKLVIDNAIVGIGCGIIYNDVAWLAHIIVDPEHRNHGLGKLITQTLVDLVRAKGSKTINLIATDLGAPVYTRLGFNTDTEYLFFKDVTLQKIDTSFDNIMNYDSTFDKQIEELDLIASGEKRMKLLAPHLAAGKFYIEGENIKGYYLPTLGEGLIVSSSADGGTQLMQMRFQDKDFVVLPANNENAIQFLYSLGFREHRTAKRMQLGVQKVWKPEFMYGRIGGNLG